MAYSEFATDPCRSLFKRFTQVFTGPEFGANANVTIGRIAEQFVAQTEYPMPVAFDPQTLDTIGVVSFDDRLKGAVTTAHPHHDPDQRAAYNYLLNFGATSAYGVYRLPDGTRTRELLGRATTKRRRTSGLLSPQPLRFPPEGACDVVTRTRGREPVLIRSADTEKDLT